MAARPAAAQQELRAMVEREPGAVARQRPRRAGVELARLFVRPERARPRRRTGRARLHKALHGLFARLPRRTLCHEPAAAGPLPDAGQSGGLAGADLCAARRAPGWQPSRWIAVGNDAKTLSVL